MSVLDFVDEELAALEAVGRRRGVRVVGGRRGAEIELDGRWVVSFSSNDYLGLAVEPALVEAAAAALARHGVGASASRLITGTSDEVSALERELAAFHGAPAALVFGSGYAANTGVIPALVGRGDVVFSDELNHASIIDGCRLSRAEVVVYPHRGADALARRLSAGTWRRRLIVTESVFSMDGDRAPLGELAGLARSHEAMLMVDDAHAVGAAGMGGRGLGWEVGADVVVGTLGKAFGSAGAYVLGGQNMVQLIWNSARSLVFSTALPPAVSAASRAAVAWMSTTHAGERRDALCRNIAAIGRGLRDLGLVAGAVPSDAVIPIMVGDERRAMRCTEALLERGLLVQAIRPPTVPRGTSRLRIAVSALHDGQHVERLLDGVRTLQVSGLLPS